MNFRRQFACNKDIKKKIPDKGNSADVLVLALKVLALLLALGGFEL